jgi:hypothetical protein
MGNPERFSMARSRGPGDAASGRWAVISEETRKTRAVPPEKRAFRYMFIQFCIFMSGRCKKLLRRRGCPTT